LCGTADTARLFDKAGIQYWRCRACALRFGLSPTNANFRTSIDDYERPYRQYLADGPGDRANVEDTVGWIESHVDLREPSVRLLDVGAGSGKFIRSLRALRRCEVRGIEPSAPLFDAYALEALEVEPVTLSELAARGADPFDVVTAFDVLEHAPDAAGFVRALGRVTKPGGYVFLSTPDTGGPLARLLGRRWHHYNAYHFSLYGAETLADAARMGGFTVIESRHRAKRMALDYLWEYTGEFLLSGRRRSRLKVPAVTFSVNVGDILSAVWMKSA
jgi:2-polyprenyl-3-methyl-5-hydroxy-6-metoxy-1,4-benzoquinol methylase